MENSEKKDVCPLEPLAPLQHVVYHKQVTVKEAFDLLSPDLRGLYFTFLVVRADAHRTAAALGKTEREQKALRRLLDDLTTKALNHILTFPTAFAVKDARKTLRLLRTLPDYVAQAHSRGEQYGAQDAK